MRVLLAHSRISLTLFNMRRLDTHVCLCLGTDSSSSRRIGKKAFSRRLEDGYCPFPSDGWEIFEEVFERRASFEVVEEALNWHSSAREAKRSAHDFGITTNEGCIHACLQWHQSTRQEDARTILSFDDEVPLGSSS